MGEVERARAPNWDAGGLPAPRPRPSGAVTVADILDAYLASRRFQSLAPRTQAEYGRVIRRLRPIFGCVRVSDWQTAWGAHYLAYGPSVRANRDIAVLGAAWGAAASEGIAPRNPIRDLQRNAERPRERYVSDTELASFLASSPPRLRAYVRLKMATGCRAGQLLALQWEHWRDGELRVAAVKGGLATRYGGGEVAGALAAVKGAWGGDGRIGPMFRASRGELRPIASVSLRYLWRQAMRAHLAAGGDHFREHDLRAKVGSDAEGLERAMMMLGHSGSAVTSRVYRRRPRRVESARSVAAAEQLQLPMAGTRRPQPMRVWGCGRRIHVRAQAHCGSCRRIRTAPLEPREILAIVLRALRAMGPDGRLKAKNALAKNAGKSLMDAAREPAGKPLRAGRVEGNAGAERRVNG